MDLIKLKDPTEFNIREVAISFERENDSLRRIILQDGQQIWIIASSIYGNTLEIFKPKPPEMVQAYRLTGKFLVFPVDKIFTEEWEAEQALGDLERAGATECVIREVLIEKKKVTEPSNTSPEIPF